MHSLDVRGLCGDVQDIWVEWQRNELKLACVSAAFSESCRNLKSFEKIILTSSYGHPYIPSGIDSINLWMEKVLNQYFHTK